MTQYIGSNSSDLTSQMGERYFYGLRRNDDGEVFLAVLDQLSQTDAITINIPGNQEDNYDGFAVGQDFFEGRDVNHNKVFANLNYEQFRWDNRKINYYINDDGELVARLNQPYNYES